MGDGTAKRNVLSGLFILSARFGCCGLGHGTKTRPPATDPGGGRHPRLSATGFVWLRPFGAAIAGKNSRLTPCTPASYSCCSGWGGSKAEPGRRREGARQPAGLRTRHFAAYATVTGPARSGSTVGGAKGPASSRLSHGGARARSPGPAGALVYLGKLPGRRGLCRSRRTAGTSICELHHGPSRAATVGALGLLLRGCAGRLVRGPARGVPVFGGRSVAGTGDSFNVLPDAVFSFVAGGPLQSKYLGQSSGPISRCFAPSAPSNARRGRFAAPMARPRRPRSRAAGIGRCWGP